MRLLATVLLAALATLVPDLVAAPASAAEHTVQSLYFRVTVDGGAQTCDVVGDLYLPASASSTNQVPAILTTNGFGGSKDDQVGMAIAYAERGYAVLSYSGLGFGGSGCKITLDDPAVDGEAAQQLIDYLAGETGIAFTDADRTVPAPALDVIRLDEPSDPRIGMVGGSYGGAIQLAAASLDDRLDALVPMITWHDLSYSLAPNNLVPSALQAPTPGAAKLSWVLGFSLLGITGGLAEAPADPERLIGCPNFADFVCGALLTAGATGIMTPETVAELQRRSPIGYASTVTAPTLIVQGQSDTLFNLNEGLDTYRLLQAQGTEAKMIWGNGGHSGPWAPGEADLAAAPDETYIGGRIADWFDHHLMDLPVDTGPELAYFREWVDYEGNAAPAFATSDTPEVGTPTRLYLSGTELTPDADELTVATSSFLTPVGGLPTSTDPMDVVGDLLDDYVSVPEVDLPGTFTSYTTPTLADDLDVVGQPMLDLRVSAPAAALTQASGPAGQLVLFVKLAEVTPDGTATIVRNLVAPVRVSDVDEPFTVRLPALVNRFDAGNQLRLTIAGGSTNYRGGLTEVPVTIATGSAEQVMTLPTLRAFPDVVPPTVDPGPGGEQPPTGGGTGPGGGTGVVQMSGSGVLSTSATPGTGDQLPRVGAPVMLLVLLLGVGMIATGCVTLRRRFVPASATDIVRMRLD